MRQGSGASARALVAAMLLLGSVLGALAPVPASASAGDGAALLVRPFPPAIGMDGNLTLRAVTAADGQDYYLFTVRLLLRDATGAWSAAPLDPADVRLRVAEPSGEGVRATDWGAPADAFAFAGDPTRVLVTVPAAARPAGLALIEAEAAGWTGAYNPRKDEAQPDVADALDPVPAPVRFLEKSLGAFAHDVGVEIRPTATGFDVHVSTLSPFVEATNLTVQGETRPILLNASGEAVEHYEGDPVGVVATTERTRFSQAGRGSFGDPVARFLLCQKDVPCTQNIQSIPSLTDARGDGRPSTSPVAEALTHAWNWGDAATSTGALADHNWSTPGLYTITLTVTDASGRTDNASAPLLVLNRAPIGTLHTGHQIPTRIAPLLVTAHAEDPDGFVTNYRWFLDGEPQAAAQGSPSLWIPAGKLGLGPHAVQAAVYDDQGAVKNLHLTLIVLNLRPHIRGHVADAHVPDHAPVRFTDDSRDADGEILAYTWDFGDGTRLECHRDTGCAPGNETFESGRNTTHAYAAEGVYRPRLQVHDNDGGTSIQTLGPVVVDGTAPTPRLDRAPAPPSGWYTSPLALQASATDAYSEHPVLRLTANDEAFDPTTAPVRLTLNESGVHTVHLTAEDGAGNAANLSATLPLDLDAPEIRFDAPAPYASGIERLVVRAPDSASGTARLRITVNGEPLASANGTSTLVAEWDTTRLTPGPYILRVSAHDVAGHVRVHEARVLVLNLPLLPVGGVPIP